MKKIAWLIFVFYPIFLYASVEEPYTTTFGIRLGPSLSQVNIKRDKKKEENRYGKFPLETRLNLKKEKKQFSNEPITRYHVGIFVSKRLRNASHVDIYWEILYTGKGGKQIRKDPVTFKTDELILPLSCTITLNYIASNIKWTFSPGRIDKNYIKNLFYISGFYIAYLLNAKQNEVFQTRNGEEIHIDKDIMKDFPEKKLRRFDLGFIMGAGYEFDIGLITSFTFNMGLIRLLKQARGINWDGHFSIGYNFAKLL